MNNLVEQAKLDIVDRSIGVIGDVTRVARESINTIASKAAAETDSETVRKLIHRELNDCIEYEVDRIHGHYVTEVEKLETEHREQLRVERDRLLREQKTKALQRLSRSETIVDCIVYGKMEVKKVSPTPKRLPRFARQVDLSERPSSLETHRELGNSPRRSVRCPVVLAPPARGTGKRTVPYGDSWTAAKRMRLQRDESCHQDRYERSKIEPRRQQEEQGCSANSSSSSSLTSSSSASSRGMRSSREDVTQEEVVRDCTREEEGDISLSVSDGEIDFGDDASREG